MYNVLPQSSLIALRLYDDITWNCAERFPGPISQRDLQTLFMTNIHSQDQQISVIATLLLVVDEQFIRQPSSIILSRLLIVLCTIFVNYLWRPNYKAVLYAHINLVRKPRVYSTESSLQYI